jgi:hypothetical protein
MGLALCTRGTLGKSTGTLGSKSTGTLGKGMLRMYPPSRVPTKSQGKNAIKQWRKGKTMRQICLDCSRPTVTPPDKAVEANELHLCIQSTPNENGLANSSSPCRGESPRKRKSASPCGLSERTPSPLLSPPSRIQIN